jgi:tRNA A-37 threonylcarbamoyl transferase component Bud32
MVHLSIDCLKYLLRISKKPKTLKCTSRKFHCFGIQERLSISAFEYIRLLSLSIHHSSPVTRPTGTLTHSMFDELAYRVDTETGVSLASMRLIQDEYWDTTGLQFRFDCRGVFADITMSPEDPTTCQESPSVIADIIMSPEHPTTCQESPSIIAEHLEKYDKATTTWNDEPEPAAADIEIAEKEILEFVYNLCRPMLRGLVPPGSENYDRHSIPENLQSYMYPKSVNLQIVESNGNPEVIRRDDLPPFSIYQPIPVIAPKGRELPCYSPSQVAVVDMYRPWAMKVSVDGNIMCCKINGTLHDSFAREYRVLQQISDSDNSDSIRVPKLKGLIQVGEGIVGVLMDFIETDEPDLTYNLSGKELITEFKRVKWALQLTEILRQLHAIEVVWGDAKTANVVVDKDSNVWVVDFGGGRTRGWVNDELVNTKEGDLQALEKIFQDIRGENSKDNIMHGRTFGMDAQDGPEVAEEACHGSCGCHPLSKEHAHE